MEQIKRFILVACLALALTSQAANPIKIDLWPDGAPTKNGFKHEKEHIDDNKLWDVANAELWIYPAKNPNGQCVIMAPGGGYRCLCIYKEGTMLADWFNSLGITYAILKYRMPNGHKEIPLQDAERAMEIMRAKAGEFGYSPNKIGIMGGSAGGHFAAMISTMYSRPETRPDFQILFYPLISMDYNTIGHKGATQRFFGPNPTAEEMKQYSLQYNVSPTTPPAFILLSSDDNIVNPQNSLEYVKALQKNRVPYDLHIFPDGGHGYGFLDTCPYKDEWQRELERWLNKLNTRN